MPPMASSILPRGATARSRRQPGTVMAGAAPLKSPQFDAGADDLGRLALTVLKAAWVSSFAEDDFCFKCSRCQSLITVISKESASGRRCPGSRPPTVTPIDGAAIRFQASSAARLSSTRTGGRPGAWCARPLGVSPVSAASSHGVDRPP